MTLILEKLSRYWQLRFVVVGVGIALIVYAILLPDPENKSRDASIQSVAAAPLRPMAEASLSEAGPKSNEGRDLRAFSSSASMEKKQWTGENREAVSQLQTAVDSAIHAALFVDSSESVRGLRAAADKGDAVAQFLLGHAYEAGLGVPEDMTQTLHWYALAAEARPAGAANPQPAVKDLAQALDAYKKLAELGNEKAELYMGLAYDFGQDVPRNVVEATRWFRKAAAQGSESAANNLGVIYLNGDGVPKDSEESASWFRTAANRGSASAQYSLGRLYYTGEGVARNETEAAAWLQKAAAQGNAPAQKLLSLMYATGRGVEGSAPMAYMWINLASARDGQARNSRDEIEKVMPTDEVAEGQRLTHEWLAQHGGER